MSAVTEFDFKILNFIHEQFSCGFLDFIMPKITYLGSGGFVWIIIAVIMLFFQKSRKTGIVLGAGLLSGFIIGNVFLKNVVARERPCWINQALEILIAVPNDYSFPSGHTLSSFIAATIIMKYNGKMGIAAYALAFAISFSRLYLYVHFPTDVLAGAILGILIGLIVCKLSEKI